jgi:hypothetical protein
MPYFRKRGICASYVSDAAAGATTAITSLSTHDPIGQSN